MKILSFFNCVPFVDIDKLNILRIFIDSEDIENNKQILEDKLDSLNIIQEITDNSNHFALKCLSSSKVNKHQIQEQYSQTNYSKFDEKNKKIKIPTNHNYSCPRYNNLIHNKQRIFDLSFEKINPIDPKTIIEDSKYCTKISFKKIDINFPNYSYFWYICINESLTTLQIIEEVNQNINIEYLYDIFTVLSKIIYIYSSKMVEQDYVKELNDVCNFISIFNKHNSKIAHETFYLKQKEKEIIPKFITKIKEIKLTSSRAQAIFNEYLSYIINDSSHIIADKFIQNKIKSSIVTNYNHSLIANSLMIFFNNNDHVHAIEQLINNLYEKVSSKLNIINKQINRNKFISSIIQNFNEIIDIFTLTGLNNIIKAEIIYTLSEQIDFIKQSITNNNDVLIEINNQINDNVKNFKLNLISQIYNQISPVDFKAIGFYLKGEKKIISNLLDITQDNKLNFICEINKNGNKQHSSLWLTEREIDEIFNFA